MSTMSEEQLEQTIATIRDFMRREVFPLEDRKSVV